MSLPSVKVICDYKMLLLSNILSPKETLLSFPNSVIKKYFLYYNINKSKIYSFVTLLCLQGNYS